jgi:hypothetical protein
MDWSIVKAMPLGLVMFSSLVWGYYRRRAGHRRAREDYPALATRLGISFRAPSSKDQIGHLYGTLRGYAVYIDPDDQRKLIVRFRGAPKVDLRNYESTRRSGQIPYFSFRERSANEYFGTRYADPEIGARLNEAELSRLLEPFAKRYRYEVKELNITEHGVTCVLNFGNPPHIPVAAIETLLPVLLDWAEVIEPASSSIDVSCAELPP